MSDRAVFSVFGEAVEIIVPSKATNYSFCIAMQTSPLGGGPPPHKHEREDEVFMVVEGEYEFFDSGVWVPFKKGEVRYSLRGNFHGFRNSGTATGKLLFLTNGGGIDEYFEAISTFVLPKDLDRLTDVSKHYGYIFMPPETSPA